MASENSARSPGAVAELENAPSTTQARATPIGQRLRHHSERQASAPKAPSTTICPTDRGVAVERSEGLRKRAPNTAAIRQPAASRTR
jgi:ribosomal protein S12